MSEEPRVELRRFLGGVPFSHEREITPAERGELRKETVPYIALGVLFLVLSIVAFVGTWLGGTVMVPLGVTIGIALASVPLCSYFWVRPLLQSLRSGLISVYLGRLSDIAAFDATQAHYKGQSQIGEHLNRYVEILAIGETDRIWRFEGIPHHDALAAVRPVRVAMIPDRDERGERRLTREEVRELRLRASEFRKVGPFLLQEAMATFVAGGFYIFTFGFPGPWSAWGGLAVLGLLNVLIWGPYLRRLRFAVTAMRDAKAGVVRDGWLPSDMPWVIGGEPARWRIGRVVNGTNAVTKEQAIALEQTAAPAGETS
jgi:hypothetical protein